MKLTINHIAMHIEVAGTGPPLLLLHGFTGAGANWEAFLSSWERSFQVIMVDLIGHGETEAPTQASRYTMKNTVRDLVAMLDALSIESAYVLGYSMGGRAALAMAVEYPERVRALLLESSSPGLRTAQERHARIQKDEQQAAYIEANGVAPFVYEWEKLPLFATQSEAVKQSLRQQRLQNTPTGLANSLRGMGTGAQDSFWEKLPMLNVPVLLVVGGLDQKFRGIAKEMDQSLPNSHIMTVPEAGHTVHMEKQQLFGKIVEEWITKNERTE